MKYEKAISTQKLPLTLFERYLIHEDIGAHPCWILIRLRFRGELRREALQRAWEGAAARHPLLLSVVERDWLGQRRWSRAEDPRPAVEWVGERRPSGWPVLRPIDLRKETGFRLFAGEGADGTDLFVQAHHAVVDGAGAFAVLGDLLLLYAKGLGANVEVAELRPDLLPGRNRFGLSLWDKVKLAPSMALGLCVSAQLHARTVTPLVPREPAADTREIPADVPVLASRRFPPEDFAALRRAAKREGVAVHEIFVRDVQAAAGAFMRAEGKADPMGWSRLVVPVPLRRPSDAQLPGANVVSMVVIDRRVKSTLNRTRLLKRAHEDMAWVKRRRFGYVFLVMLRLCAFFPGGIRAYCRRRGSHATILMTNLGQPFAGNPLLDREGRARVPGAVLEDVQVAAPCRPGTCAGIALGVYGGGIWADLSYDPRVLTAAQAEALVRAFADQLKLSLA